MSVDEHLEKLHAAVRDEDDDSAREQIAALDRAITAGGTFVPAAALAEAFAVAERLGPMSALQTANMLVQAEPGALITDGLPYFLVVSDAALDRRDVSGYVTRLWRNLAVNDPPSLPAIAESEFVGRLPVLTGVLSKRLRDMARAQPQLAFDVRTSLATMLRLQQGAERNVTQAIDDALLDVTEQCRLLTVASEIERATFTREHVPLLNLDESRGSPDPRVDDLLGRAASRNEWLAGQALEELTGMVRKPSWALMTGLCDAIDDLWTHPRDEDLAVRLAHLLYLACKEHPKRIPARAITRLLQLPDIPTRIGLCLLAVLARAEPEFVIDEFAEQTLLWTLAEPSFAGMYGIWTPAAVARPEPVIAFTTEWWAREGWASTLGQLLSSSLVGLVNKSPQHRDRIVRLLRQQVVAEPAPEPGMIIISSHRKPENDLARLGASS